MNHQNDSFYSSANCRQNVELFGDIEDFSNFWASFDSVIKTWTAYLPCRSIIAADNLFKKIGRECGMELDILLHLQQRGVLRCYVLLSI